MYLYVIKCLINLRHDGANDQIVRNFLAFHYTKNNLYNLQQLISDICQKDTLVCLGFKKI